MRFTIFQESRKGAREVNQDRIAYTYSRDTLLLVVADGMGGHAGGEIAAQIAVRLFIERFQQEAKPILSNPLKFLQETIAARPCGARLVREPVLDARNAAHDLRCRASCRRGHAYWAHVGDSRFYLFRQGKLIGVDQGPFEGAVPRRPGHHRRRRTSSTHPDRNKIFSCLGGAGRSGDRPVEAHAASQRRHPDPQHRWIVERLSGSARFRRWLTSTPILKTAPQMMREAEERGGAEGDNLSAIIVRWGPETLADQPTTTTETLELGEFETQIDSTLTLTDRAGIQRDLTDDEIERAIAEIQSTIQKYRK